MQKIFKNDQNINDPTVVRIPLLETKFFKMMQTRKFQLIATFVLLALVFSVIIFLVFRKM